MDTPTSQTSPALSATRATETRTPWLRTRSGRGLMVLAGAAAFLGVASIVKPPPQGANASPTPPFRHVPAPVATKAAIRAGVLPPHPKGWKLLGILESREHLLRCYASPEGPRYSVYTHDGRLLQGDLPADEVYRAFPDLDLEKLRLDPAEPKTLMLAPIE